MYFGIYASFKLCNKIWKGYSKPDGKLNVDLVFCVNEVRWFEAALYISALYLVPNKLTLNSSLAQYTSTQLP